MNREKLTRLNLLLGVARDTKSIASLASAVSIVVEDVDFLEALQADRTAPKEVKTSVDMYQILHRYLHFLLFKRDYASAAIVLWGPEIFSPEPRSVKMVWDALFSSNLIAVMGGSAQGKSYGAAAWTLLDWLLDPNWTRIEIMSTDSEHLKKNLWGDIHRLYSGSVLKLPGSADALSIAASDEAKRAGFGFFVVFAERGPDSRGKLKGGHLRPRTGVSHPLFGRNTRRRILLDEAQEIPPSVFDDIPNIVASVDGVEHVKVFTAANPKDEFSRYGMNCRPPGGWGSIDRYQAEQWVSETGWSVVRLNAMLSENVQQKKVVFQRMQTYEGVQKAIKAAGGDTNSPQVWTFVYGMFPPCGLLTAVIKRQHINNNLGELLFLGETFAVAALDPAFTGDLPAMASGRAGTASGYYKFGGELVRFKKPRFALQIDTVGILPQGLDSQDLADQAMERCRLLGVKPEHFGIDKTGPGLGVHDIIRRQWHIKVDGHKAESDKGREPAEIHGICYASKPTETPVSEEDTSKPKDQYTSICAEMWYAAGKLIEFSRVFFGKGVCEKTLDELTARQGGSSAGDGKKLSIESKVAYKARGRSSPDRADASTMVMQVSRVAFSELRAKSDDTPDNPPLDLSKWSMATSGKVPGWTGGDPGYFESLNIDTLKD